MKYEAENDWQIDAPYLASLPKVNSYLVPSNYFQNVYEQKKSIFWLKYLYLKNDKFPFAVPSNYFQNLSIHLQSIIFLDYINSLALNNGFFLPEEYFNKLHKKMLDNIFLPSLPEDYFEKLGTRISNRILQEENILSIEIPGEKLVVSVASTSSKTKFSFSNRITTQLTKLWWNSNFIKYASAASIILISAIILFANQQYRLKSKANELVNEQVLYDIDEQDIIDSIYGSYSDQHMLNAINADLENYLLYNYSQSDLNTEL